MPEVHEKAVRVLAPSNIALIKYWGKSDVSKQWPTNDSLSMTLNSAVTACECAVNDQQDHRVELNHQIVTRETEPKVFKSLDRIRSTWEMAPFLDVKTVNRFPTGCGMASSASGFCALALAATAAYRGIDFCLNVHEQTERLNTLANLARLGSGSAIRSLLGGFVRWHRGKDPQDQTISQVMGADDWRLADIVALVSTEAKSIGSSEAHQLAFTSPLFAPRLAGIDDRLRGVEEAIRERSLKKLGPLIEQEALEMHAVMMSSSPAVFYFGKDVGEILSLIRRIRQDYGLSCYFTMDAGPNIHIICEPKDVEQLKNLLLQYKPQLNFFEDETGRGPSIEPIEGVSTHW